MPQLERKLREINREVAKIQRLAFTKRHHTTEGFSAKLLNENDLQAYIDACLFEGLPVTGDQWVHRKKPTKFDHDRSPVLMGHLLENKGIDGSIYTSDIPDVRIKESRAEMITKNRLNGVGDNRGDERWRERNKSKEKNGGVDSAKDQEDSGELHWFLNTAGLSSFEEQVWRTANGLLHWGKPNPGEANPTQAEIEATEDKINAFIGKFPKWRARVRYWLRVLKSESNE